MDWLSSHVRPVVDSVLYAFIGTVTLVVLFWVVERLMPFSLRKEIEEDHNTALGIILGSFIIALGLVISAAIRG